MWLDHMPANLPQTFPEDVDALVDSREAVRALAAALSNVDGAGSGTTLFVVLGTQQAA